MSHQPKAGFGVKPNAPDELVTTEIHPNPLQSRMRAAALFSGVFSILVGIGVWVGWWAGIESLKRVFPGLIAMNPLTALCLMGGGAALLLEICGCRRLACVLAAVILTVGLLKLGAYIAGFNFPADGWFFRDQLHLNEPVPVNRIAPNTALGLVFLGYALLFPDRMASRGMRHAEYAAIALALVALLALVGYIHEVSWLYTVPARVPMALHTSVALLVLAMGVMFSCPDRGLMQVVTSDGASGILLRRMLPVMIPAYILAGAFTNAWAAGSGHRLAEQTAVYAMVCIGFFCISIIWCARALHRAEQERQKAVDAMRCMNAEIAQQAAHMEAANAELESFSYSVSHDLRAPLRGISGFAQALEEHAGSVLDETSRGYLERVRNASARMSTLIDDLLKLSRLTRAEMKREDVDLSALAETVVDALRKAEPERVVEVSIAPGMRAFGDPALLRILLDNLLGNAWKFTANNPAAKIELTSEAAENGHVVFHVRDNGVGFDNRYGHKLFGAFQRLHSQEEFPGTGVGLATVQRIVHRHLGRVSADGAPGRGAVFSFSLETSNPSLPP